MPWLGLLPSHYQLPFPDWAHGHLQNQDLRVFHAITWRTLGQPGSHKNHGCTALHCPLDTISLLRCIAPPFSCCFAVIGDDKGEILYRVLRATVTAP